MTAGQDQLRACAEACRIVLPHRFVWFGVPHTAVPAPIQRLSATDQRTYLRLALRERIYQDAFSRGWPQPTKPPEDTQASGEDRGFADSLAAASTSTGYWEPGWTIIAAEHDRLGIDSGNLQLWVSRADVACDADTTRPARPGDTVSVRMPRGSYDLSPGYYSVFSDHPGTGIADDLVVRLYFALRPTGAPTAMHILTEGLNTAELPFRLKMLSSPAHYTRADSAVLYLGATNLDRAVEPLATAITSLAPLLVDRTPMFTRSLAAGVGLAEEPTGKQSFGQHRSTLVAEGLIRAAERHARTPRHRLGHILTAWCDAGLSPDMPHLSPGSEVTRYDSLVSAIQRRTASPMPHIAAVPVDPRPAEWPTVDGVEVDPLPVAVTIANRIGEEAIWHEDSCTWLSVVPTVDDRGQPTLAHGAVGQDLYDGTAGIAVFLAIVGTLTGQRKLLDTARGAARQALLRLASPSQPGLYVGRTGRVLAAAVTGLLTHDEQLTETAVANMDTGGRSDNHDLLVGSAGTIVGLLTLARLTDNSRLVRQAARLGTNLLAAAHQSRRGWSWSAAGRTPGLTGLSHGASGIATALLQLAAATGDDRFAHGAHAGFRYEHSWYDPAEGNWPDLRDGAEKPTTFLNQWCHGAPGIALSRLYAAAQLDDATYRAEAAAALHTTLRGTRRALAENTLSFSLCHGLAGNADILHEALSLLERGPATEARNLIADIAATGVNRHHAGGQPWQCGVPVPDLEVPGLMLGLAGVGYHYLRLANLQPAPPSLLLIIPDAFANRIHDLANRQSLNPPLNPMEDHHARLPDPRHAAAGLPTHPGSQDDTGARRELTRRSLRQWAATS